jgi:Glyoxalase-like domain
MPDGQRRRGGLAGFYARLLGAPAELNEYYVEIQAGSASVGFSRRWFAEHREAGGVILDFAVRDVDAEYGRIAALGVD